MILIIRIVICSTIPDMWDLMWTCAAYNKMMGDEGAMQPFTRRVIEIVKGIPEGSVMTYGQVAELAGSKRGARQVVRVLHSMSTAYELPWHRVINAKGEIALSDDEARFKQIVYLNSEGVMLDEAGRIDLVKYQAKMQ